MKNIKLNADGTHQGFTDPAEKLAEVKKQVSEYSSICAKSLGLIFSSHGTNERLFIDMVDFYLDLETNLVFINELIDK